MSRGRSKRRGRHDACGRRRPAPKMSCCKSRGWFRRSGPKSVEQRRIRNGFGLHKWFLETRAQRMHSCQPSSGRPYLGRADGPNDTLAVHVGMKIHVRVSGPPAAASGERGDGLPATSARSRGEGNGGIQASALGHIGFSTGKFIGFVNTGWRNLVPSE